ncbi:MAG: amidase family protein, partial [Dehalococcoidia bacterium]
GYAVVDPEVVKITSEAARIFEELGGTVEEPAFAIDNPALAHLAIFFTGNYATYGHLLEEQPENLGDNARTCLEQGRNTTGAEYALAIREVQIMRDRFDTLLETYDLLLTPTMAVPPFPIGQPPDRIGGVEVPPRTSYSPLTRAFNVTGLPAASVPVGFSAEGLPIGMQVVGRFGNEATVLRACAAFEQARPWAQHRPAVS